MVIGNNEKLAQPSLSVAEKNDSQTTTAESAKRVRRTQLLAFSALIWCQIMEGWHDGTIGPLLPAMQDHYHVMSSPGYTSVGCMLI